MPYPNYTITEYMSDQQTRGRSYSKYQRMLLSVSLVLFAAGLVTLYFGFVVFTVLALGIGVIFHQGSSQYTQLKDQMTEHHHLAMLIATQQSELVALRSEVQSVLHEKGHDRPTSDSPKPAHSNADQAIVQTMG